MSEKFVVPHIPADKPGGGPSKPPEQKERVQWKRKRSGLGGIIDRFKRARAEKTHHKERRAQYDSENARARQAHTEGPELQIPRLHALAETLANVTIDDERVRKLARQLAELLQKQGIGRPAALSENEKKLLADEARQYIFLGILRPYSESKSLVNEEGVLRHLRTYLMWRWAEEAWRKKEPPSKWKVWKSGEKEIKTTSIPRFQKAFNKWKDDQKKLRPGSGPTRPPTLPDVNIVLMLAKRTGEDHMQWQIDRIKP